MKKGKLACGIVTGLLAVGALAACSSSGPEYSSKGVILTYEVNGEKIEYTADKLFGETVVNQEHAEEMFNQVYKLVVRNYFTIENPDGDGTNTGSKQMDEINRIAEKNVQIDKDTAEKNSDTNGTSYKTEFEAILSSKGCEDEEELKAYYVFEEQQTKFKENFYKIYADENNTKFNGYNLLRDGASNDNDAKNPTGYAGYLETKVPYHVSHILVNVDDSASNNYWNGTISQDNVEHLKRVVDGLMDPTKSFGTVAHDESDDGSKSQYGDLGIVDKDKATEESDKFVKEFILGLYSYDNMYNPDAKIRARANNSNIGRTVGLATKPSYIDYKVFKELYDNREVEGSLVIGSSSQNFYPRNVVYNQVLNNHGVSLIVNNDITAEKGNFKLLSIYDAKTESYTDKYVLCARGTKTPVLVTRAGASYQGIHFIIANRSPFADDTTEATAATALRDLSVGGVKLSEYYTTKYPGQKGYPQKDNGDPKQTYVNTIDSLTSKYKERAEKVAEEVKSFDTNIERVIYNKYFEIDSTHKLQFTEAGKKVEQTINEWITRKNNEKSNSTHDSWEEYWDEYVDMLEMQEEQSSKKLKKGCAIAFKLASSKKTKADVNALYWHLDDGDVVAGKHPTYPDDPAYTFTFDAMFNEIGGACNDGETHK